MGASPDECFARQPSAGRCHLQARRRGEILNDTLNDSLSFCPPDLPRLAAVILVITFLNVIIELHVSETCLLGGPVVRMNTSLSNQQTIPYSYFHTTRHWHC